MQVLYSITDPITGRWKCGLSLEHVRAMLNAGRINDSWLICRFGDADNAVRIAECADVGMRGRRAPRPAGGDADPERESARGGLESDDLHFRRVLGLSGKMTRADVKRKYRELAAQYHPDKVKHLGPKLRDVAEREMKAINEAFEYFKQRYGI